MKSLVLLSFLIYGQVACAYTKGKVYKLTILHTNDHHGRFWPNKEGELGLAPRATLIQNLRAEIQKDGGHVLLLDAGDVNTGVPQSDLQDAEPDFKGMALLGYDVMALGNHEFDKPLGTILKQREWGGFPFISANIYNKETNERLFPSHIIKEVDDLKVTIFGLTTEDTPLKSNPKNTKDLKFVPILEEAKRLVPLLRKDTDVLIALTHIGHYAEEAHGADAPGDVTLARQVNGIDVIVGGHTQKPLFQPDIQNGSIIVQAAEWGKYVGRVDLEVLDGKVTLKEAKLIPVNLKDSEVKIEADAYVESVLRPFKEKGDASLLIDLGTADAEFVGVRDIVRSQETNLGNLVTLAYKSKVKADLCITNSGGLRFSILPGKVTYESVLMVLPFAGELAIAELTGKELKEYLEFVIFNLTAGSGSFPQMSGVDIVAGRETKTITTLKINGKDVCPFKKYVIALPDFIAGGGDKYPKLNFRRTGFVDADILKDFVLSVKDLKAQDYAPRDYIKYE
jgi:5'-nucleotidase / UDP-sugar diphosphatase